MIKLLLKIRLRTGVSLFSRSVVRNVRDTKMITHVTDGARRGRGEKEQCLFFLLVLPPSLLASRGFAARGSHAVHSSHLTRRKRKTALLILKFVMTEKCVCVFLINEAIISLAWFSSKTLKCKRFFFFHVCARQKGIMVPSVPSERRGNWG